MSKINPDRLLKDLRQGRFNRRSFMHGLAATGLVASMLPATKAKADTTITVYEWAGYDIPDIFIEYVEKYGSPPEFAVFGEEEEALQKMRGGFVADVSHPCTSNVRRWRDAGVITALDVSRIERWDEIIPSLLTPKGVQIDGEWYHVPFDWGNTSLLYRADLVEITDPSYAVLLDEQYAGRISTFDSAEDAAAIGGLLAGVKDPFDQTPEEIKATFEIWKKVNANVLYYWSDPTQMEQGLSSGEIVIATAWNESMGRLRANGIDVQYMVPKEGMLTWVCGFAANLNGPGDDDEVYDLLNSVLDPEVGKYIIEEFNYGHSNAKSYEIADPEVLASMGLNDPLEVMRTTQFFQEMPPETREAVNAEFEQVKAGL